MLAEELSVLAAPNHGELVHFFDFFDDDWLSELVESCEGIHVEVAALQTMDTLSYFGTGHVFTIPFKLQEWIEHSFEFFYEIDLLEVLFEFVDTYDGNRHHFFVALRIIGSIFVILAIVHFVEVCEELS